MPWICAPSTSKGYGVRRPGAWACARASSPTCVFFLHPGLGLLAAFQQGVAAECGDPHAGSPIVATMAALMVCSRFSAWSNTMEAGDSKTSSVTSSASSPRLP